MIRISDFKNSDLLPELITSDIGEIVKIEDISYQSCGLMFCDSKGYTFATITNWNAVRYYSMCTIYGNIERNDLIPAKFRKGIYPTDITCNDPRVIWASIIALWITNKIPNEKRLNKKSRSKVLTELLPTYEEASVWLVKNRFKLFATKENGDAINDPYLRNYSDLVTPPKVDWSIFPNTD